MSKKYKRFLSFIGFLLFVSVLLSVGYCFYDKVIKGDYVVIVDGNLSINYLGGNSVVVEDEEKEVKFSVTNNSTKEVIYSISLEDVKYFNDNTSLTLLYKDNSFIVEPTNKKELLIADNYKIGANETASFVLQVKSKDDNRLSFDILVSEEASSIETFARTILKQNNIKKPATKIASEAATLDEGLISDIDDNGTTYYFRGNVTNNYVNFADNLWRIVRINGDGTIRLVLNKNLDSVHNYTSNETDDSYGASDIKLFLDDWYNINLKKHEDYIATGKFCNDLNINEGSEYFNSYVRVYTNLIPTFNCLGEKVGSLIGLLSIDEIIYAGASTSINNEEYYLNNSDVTSYWTMSAARFRNNTYYPFMIGDKGNLITDSAPTLNRGVRPVINLSDKVVVNGTGTSLDPYIIVEN